ncbi:MBL fold metallo-hydrolase [Nocardioides marinquilinus]|uniref:MBL fold metallo-hydrolase n=1 Tax=Nocardioides marinquilinus TaxID=1210400 RepID=A0ABP9PHY0_9ACTN
MAPDVPAPDPGTSTAHAVSPDSGEHWSAEGAWPVAPGVHRIPLPLPMDGLKAVNVYAVEDGDGLTLVDGGWAIPVARERLERGLAAMGAGLGDVRRFLVTHVHRDHFTLATVLGRELGVDVALGLPEKPAIDLLNDPERFAQNPFAALLRAAGAPDVAEQWAANAPEPDPEVWRRPTSWIDGDRSIALDGRVLDAVHTPGHTAGHYVFADRAEGLLFGGDHVLPTITPSIGFVLPPPLDPLGDFLGSLGRVLELPNLRLLPAHGPVAASSHDRARALLAHHDERLRQCLDLVPAGGSGSVSGAVSGSVSAADVARGLGWTRHLRAYDELDPFNRGMAVMETRAHLDLLVSRGDLVTEVVSGVALYRSA